MESWDIEKMMEEPPTDAYYEALAKDLRDRRKKACPHLLDHLVSLEAFSSRYFSAFPSASTRQRSALPRVSFRGTRSDATAVLRMRNAAKRL